MHLDRAGVDPRVPDAVPTAEVGRACRAGVPATVPGALHADLVAAGLLADPLTHDHERAARWVGEGDWTWTAAVPVDAGAAAAASAELVLEGVQGLVTVLIDGQVVGTCANMLREHRFDVRGRLRPGTVELRLECRSVAAAMRADARDDLPHDWDYAYNTHRVMAAQAGWDWGPTLVGAGPWRDLRLETWNGTRLRADVTARLDDDLARGTVVADVVLDGAGPGPARGVVEVASGPHRARAEVVGRARVELAVPAPEPWWPAGHGRPTLHDVHVRLLPADAPAPDAATPGTAPDGPGPAQVLHRRVGFRHVRLDTAPDGHGRACTVVVNGRAVFARGACWVPDGTLVGLAGPDRARAQVRRAAQAGMTMLRVWGGGVYEQPAFYEACDEAGILVWQDFMFACAAYPEEEPLRGEVLAEARDAVRRLAAHPCLAVWCGGNEALLGWADWGWPDRVGTGTWGHGYYHELLPQVVAELGAGVPYVPGSPFASTTGAAPNTDAEGASHLWDQWNLLDHTTYRDHRPRFVGEFGHQGPATAATLAEALGPGPWPPDGPALATRQKQPGGMAHVLGRMAGHLPDPQALPGRPDDWHWAAQLVQADAVRTGVEHFRGSWPRTAGCLVWQFNDAWPAVSWSLVDHGLRPKPAWYAVRRAYAPRTVAFTRHEGAPALLLVNDTDEVWHARVAVRRVHVQGGVPAVQHLPVTVPARGVARAVPGPHVAVPGSRRHELLVADVDGLRTVTPLCRPDGVRWPAPELQVQVHPHPQGVQVEVTAAVVCADVSLFVDRVDPHAEVDDMLRLLLPGERAVFTVRTDLRDPHAWAAAAHPPVLRTRNDLWQT